MMEHQPNDFVRAVGEIVACLWDTLRLFYILEGEPDGPGEEGFQRWMDKSDD
jgi:hypothetical protein